MGNVKTRGALIAAAVAGLVGCASGGTPQPSTAAQATGAPVQCAGINSCKGKGACSGNDNACKSMNACKGKGYVEVASAADCKKQGGTVLERKM